MGTCTLYMLLMVTQLHLQPCYLQHAQIWEVNMKGSLVSGMFYKINRVSLMRIGQIYR